MTTRHHNKVNIGILEHLPVITCHIRKLFGARRLACAHPARGSKGPQSKRAVAFHGGKNGASGKTAASYKANAHFICRDRKGRFRSRPDHLIELSFPLPVLEQDGHVLLFFLVGRYHLVSTLSFLEGNFMCNKIR